MLRSLNQEHGSHTCRLRINLHQCQRAATALEFTHVLLANQCKGIRDRGKKPKALYTVDQGYKDLIRQDCTKICASCRDIGAKLVATDHSGVLTALREVHTGIIWGCEDGREAFIHAIVEK